MKLESLIVDLQVNSAALRAGLDAAAGMLANFGKSVEHIQHQIHALTEAKSFEMGKELVKGLAEFVHAGAEAAEKMGLLAQATGTSTEVFSRLNYAASLSGVATDDLGKAFVKLDKNIALAGAGVPAQSAIFQALGIKVKDAAGHVKTGAVVMSELATKFAGLEDGASKTALAVEIFGKAGAQMIPFLNEGAEGMAKFGDEADRLGITISDHAAASAREFEDNLHRVHAVIGALQTRIAAELTPALVGLTTQFLNSQNSANSMTSVVLVLSTAIKGLLTVGAAVVTVFDGITLTIGHLIAAMVLAAKGDFSSALLAIKNTGGDLGDSLETLSKRLGAIWLEPTEAAEEHEKAAKKSADPLMRLLEQTKKAAPEAAAAMKLLTDKLLELQAKSEGFGKSPLEAFEAELDKGKLSEALKKIGKDADEMRAKLIAAFSGLQDKEFDKLSLKVDFDVAQAAANTAQTVRDRTVDFNNAGKTVTNADKQGGFESFDAAMAEFAKQMDANAKLIGNAELLRSRGEFSGAQMAMEWADQAKRAADEASRAADAFKAGKEALYAAIEGAAKSLASAAGNVGKVANAALDGFKSGGVWGAIIAIIAEILSMLKGVQKIFGSMNDFFGRWIEGLDKMLGPFLDTVMNFAEAIGSLIEIFHDLGHASDVVGGLLWILSKVIDAVEIAILWVAKSFADALGGNNEINKAYAKAMLDITHGYGYHEPAKAAAGALADVATAAGKVADKFGEMSTNMPSGYRLRGAQFRADTGASGGAGGGSDGSGHSATFGTPEAIAAAKAAKDAADEKALEGNGGFQGQAYGQNGQYNSGTGLSNTPPPGIQIDTVVVQASDLFNLTKQIQEQSAKQVKRAKRNGLP